MRREHHPERHVELGAQVAGAEEQHRDDPHRLLRVVGAVPQAVGGGRQELAATEDLVDPAGRLALEDVDHQHHHREADDQPDQRRQDHERPDLDEAGRDERAKPRLDDGSAREAADQRVRGARRQSPHPRDQVPDDRADEPRQDHPLIDHRRVDDALAHRPRHAHAEAERRDEVEKRGPDDRLQRRQHARRHDGGDGVGGVVEAVDEVEDERDEDDDDDGGEHRSARDHAILRMIPSITLATSSHRSVTISIVS